MQPSIDQAVRDQKQREAAQQSFRRQFQRCKTLEQLAAAIAKARKSYDIAPWLAWICRRSGDGRKWTGATKPVAARQRQLVAIIAGLIEGGAELAMVDESERESPHALALLLELDELTPAQ